MTKALHIAENLSLPADAVTQAFAMLGRRGSGKSYAAKVLAEEMLAVHQPIVVLDPTGVWFGLRAGADGKPEGGYPVVIMGGHHGDLPLESTAGKVIAEFLVRERVPTILDLVKFGETEMQQFVADLAERFYHLNTEAVHWFVDEADEFAPQDARGGGPLWKSLGAMQRIVRRGRVKGIGCTLITQRSAVLNKSVLTQTECLVAMQTTAPQDLAAIEEWLKYHAGKEERGEIMGQLPHLQQGDAIIYSPGWLRKLLKVKIRQLRTFDSSRTPKPGEQRRTPKALAEINLDALGEQIKATVERAKADDPRELRKQIAELQRQLRERPAETKVVKEEVRVEVPVLKNGQLDRTEKVIERTEALAGKMLAEVGELKRLIAIAPRPTNQVASTLAAPKPRENIRENIRGESGRLPIGERKVLAACIQYPDGLRREQLTVLTGYKRSSRDAYIQRLREKALVAVDGERVQATAEGQAALPDAEPLPTGPALQEFWLHRLPIGERAMLEQLLAAYPNGVPREQLSETTGYQRSSRDAYLQRLRAKELVIDHGRGEVRASANLFE